MGGETVIALSLFAVLLVGTPGPGNLLAMSAGARWGFRACLPFIAGITFGKLFLNIALAGGLLALLSAVPLAELTLRYASAAYLMYLAWRIAAMRLSGGGAKNPGARLGFFAGLIVHPLNPKAWAMTTSAFAQFTTASLPWAEQAATVCAVFFFADVVFHSLWCFGGVRLVKIIGGTPAERVVMRALALLTVAVVVWSLLRGR